MPDFNSRKANFILEIKPILIIDIIVFIICSIGMVLNLVLLYLALFRKGRKAIDIVLISIISVFDCLLCLTLIFSLITRWRQGWSLLVNTSSWCQINAIFYKASVLSTLLGIALLALIRYLAFVRKKQLSNRSWICISLCLVSLMWAVVVYRGIKNRLLVLPSGLHCVPIFFGKDWETKLFGYMIITILYPVSFIIPIYYILIIIHLRRKCSQRFTPFFQRRTLHLIFTVIAYMLCIFPDYMHILLTKWLRIRRTPLSDGNMMMLTLSVTIINALFSLFLHDEINEDFRSLLSFSIPRRGSFYNF